MTKFREELITRMIEIYGYENPIVIKFCKYCEHLEETDWNNESLRLIVETHEKYPMNQED